MIIDESIRRKLDDLLRAGLINMREYRIYEIFISKRSAGEFKALVLSQVKMDLGHMINSETLKQTDNFLLIAAKFYWEKTLAAFEQSYFISHSEVIDGAKNLLEALEKPVSLEISAVGEPELIKIIKDFYAHGCPKTDKININLRNVYFDSRFDYILNWLQENNVKVTSNWNEFSQEAQGTIVIAGGWHAFSKTKEFSEKICYLISRKIPVVLLEKVDYFESDIGIQNLSDVVQVSLFEDGQLVLTNGGLLIVKPFRQIKSITRYPYNEISQESIFLFLT